MRLMDERKHGSVVEWITASLPSTRPPLAGLSAQTNLAVMKAGEQMVKLRRFVVFLLIGMGCGRFDRPPRSKALANIEGLAKKVLGPTESLAERVANRPGLAG